MTKRLKLLETRGKTHGSFIMNALVSQDLKDILRDSPGWEELNDVQKESLDMICGKISRIMSGKAVFEDHWKDIIGYAQLALDEHPPE